MTDMKHSFYDDYSEGAHPEILQYIVDHNGGSQLTYGQDEYTALATERIKRAFGVADAAIHLLPAGTVCNVTGLRAMLRPIEGVIAPSSGHINTHETGALEAYGYKIIDVSAPDGKLTPALIDQALTRYENEHTVIPKLVYLTQATELGTVYSRDELQSVVAHAKSKSLYTFLDGARLAMALASPVSGMSMQDVGELGLDMFYIGGTKNGGMFGEALVIQNPELQQDFRHYLKQGGGMISKGRFMGLQFARFFDDDQLWLSLAKHANQMAARLFDGLQAAGVTFDLTAEANQVFPILDNEICEQLQQDYGFHVWQRVDENKTKVRFVCSWATTEDQVDALIADIRQLLS